MRHPALIWIARRWMPVSMRLRGMRVAYMRMLGHLARDADAMGLEKIQLAATRLGEDLATDLEDELGLGDSLEDADAAWAIGCQAFGLSHLRREADGVITYDHVGCELHAFYARSGECHCEIICLPMVRGVTQGLAPSVKMTLDRVPDVNTTCRKSLRQLPSSPD